MGCNRNCAGCAGCGETLGAYTEAPPLAFAGWRLRVAGNPPGGQYHGFLGATRREWIGSSPWDFFNAGHTAADGVYRSPGETPPSANPNRETNTVVERHTRRTAGYALVPGAYAHLGIAAPVSPGIWDPIEILPTYPAGVIHPYPRPILPPRRPIAPLPRPPILPLSTGATSAVPQPPPVEQPAPAPAVCDASSMYRDAAGNLTCDWHNPYSLSLPAPAPTVPADTSYTPGAGQMPTSVPTDSVQGNVVSPSSSWLTDPGQELISGIPNWGILAAAAAAFMLMKGRR